MKHMIPGRKELLCSIVSDGFVYNDNWIVGVPADLDKSYFGGLVWDKM